jgi:hypothetical protein
MKRVWTTDELVDHWTLGPADLSLLANKTGATRLGFARGPSPANPIPPSACGISCCWHCCVSTACTPIARFSLESFRLPATAELCRLAAILRAVTSLLLTNVSSLDQPYCTRGGGLLYSSQSEEVSSE